MPTIFEVQDVRGRTLTIEGDREPTQGELAALFEEAFPTAPAEPAVAAESASLRPAIPEPGVAGPTLAAPPVTPPVPQAFPAIEEGMAATAKVPALTAAEAETVLTTPQVSIPRSMSIGGGFAPGEAPSTPGLTLTPPGSLQDIRALATHAPDVIGEPGTVTRGLSELGAGLVEQAVLTPAAPLLTLAGAIPGVRLAAGTLLSAAAAKGAAEKLGEASVTGNPQTITEGVGMGALAALGATGVAADAMARTAPLTAEAASKPAAPVGILPEGARKLAQLQEGQSLIDQQRIKTAAPRPDVMPARDWLTSPEFEFRNDPVAGPLATRLNETELLYKSRVAHMNEQWEALKRPLSETDQLTVSKALYANERGDTTALSSLPEPLAQAATEIRAYYDKVKARVIEDKQASVLRELSGPQQNALRQVQDGMSLEAAATENGLRAGGKAIVQSALDEMESLKSWGIEQYTTHIERGSYRVVTDDGVTVAIGETRPEAAIKADRWLKEHPEVKSVTLDSEFAPGTEFPTKLSQGQYFRMVQRLKDTLGTDAREIQDLLHKNGSIVAVKPTNKYAGPMLERRNVLKGEDNVFDVLPLYTHIMEKKLALDPVLREVRQSLGQMAPETAQQIEALAMDIKGRKTVGDKIVDHLLAPYGLRPFVYSRSLDAARQVSAHLKLGYRPVAAAVNRISGLLHTWAKVGTRYLLEGRSFLKTPEGEALLQANKPYLGIEAAFVHEAKPRAQEPLYKPLGMFQAAERYNRPEAFASFYKFAEGELGLTGEAAVQYARNATRFSQFTYNLASLPRSMRGPTGKFVFQFKPYLVKELEFISTLRGAEVGRYLAGFLAIGGPRAALYTLKSLPVLGAIGAFSKLEDWLNETAPAASRGVGGALGVDVSPSVAFQFPGTVPELFGPVVSDIHKLWTDVVQPAMAGEDRDMADVRKWATSIAPAFNYWSQLVEAASSEAGWITDTRGRPAYKPSKSDYAKLLVGAKPLEKSVQEVQSRFLRDQERIVRANRTRAIDKFLDAITAKDGAAIAEQARELAEAGVTPEMVKNASRGRNIEPQLRLLRSLSKASRAREIERFEPATPAQEEE